MDGQAVRMGFCMSRQEAKRAFIEQAGWGSAEIRFLAGDASNRRYDRLTGTDGSTAVLMDAPPEKGEDVRPFLRIATFLRENGLSAPCIHAADEAQGFLMIEDLGDRVFAREITQNPGCENTLYEAATDVLTRLHRCQPPALEPYTSPVTVPLAALAFEWYQSGAAGETDIGAKAEIHAIITRLARSGKGVLVISSELPELLSLSDRLLVMREGKLTAELDPLHATQEEIMKFAMPL